MIKHAKAGDIVYKLDYDNINKTCEIQKCIVYDTVFDSKIEHLISVRMKDSLGGYVFYTEAFKSPKAAHKAYLRILENELKTAKKTIVAVEKIYQQLRDAQAKY